MTLKLGVVMDPIESIHPKKDSTLAMLLAAQARGWQLFYMQQKDLVLRDGKVFANMRPVEVRDDLHSWHTLSEPHFAPLTELDVVLMRKDPPFDMQYIHTTYLLELAEAAGVLVVNRPQSLRDANEKLYTAWFPQCTPPTLVSRDMTQLRAFLHEHGDVIVKPLEGMGGISVFRLTLNDPNISVVFETLTSNGLHYIMAQRYIPEISAGDKRILLIDGKPIPYALARIPAAGETRGNLAAGGRGEGVPLSERDYWICEQVGPTLKKKGLVFVGLDVIGDYLTEINVTSPTCIRELDRQFNLDIAGELMECISRKLKH
jgi:glutathione synthase